MKRLFLLVSLLALALAGCGKEEEQEKKLPERFIEVSEDKGLFGDGAYFNGYVIQDELTGCQYLITEYSGRNSSTPILKPDGKPYCVEVKDEK
ncbi:hypothetical protein Goe16_01840 [Bacillus phage vB_BsuM-Goe16]|nr:hypothetical protein Goe16_01840 [Bacillus phage vB_BsuM-Goe16]